MIIDTKKDVQFYVRLIYKYSIVIYEYLNVFDR